MQLKIQNKKAPSLILLQQYFTVPFKLLQKVSYKVSTSDSPHLLFRLTPISLSSLLFHWNYSYQGVLTVPIFLNSIVNTELSYQLYDYTVSPHFETFSTWLLEHSFLHCLLLLCLLCVLILFLTAKHWSALKLSSHPSSLYYLNTEVKLKKYGDYGLSKCIPNSTNGKIIITRHQGRRKGEEKWVLPPFIIWSLKNYSNNIFSYFLNYYLPWELRGRQAMISFSHFEDGLILCFPNRARMFLNLLKKDTLEEHLGISIAFLFSAILSKIENLLYTQK